jgi:hypothetical protein
MGVTLAKQGVQCLTAIIAVLMSWTVAGTPNYFAAATMSSDPNAAFDRLSSSSNLWVPSGKAENSDQHVTSLKVPQRCCVPSSRTHLCRSPESFA